MSIQVVYKTTARATGGRDGVAETLDGRFKVKLGTPKALGGNDEGNNPEQLFAAGYAACFLGAMKFVAQHEKITLPADTSVEATVGIGPRSEGGFGLEVSLSVSLPGMPAEEARDLLKKTEIVCPYAHATKGNISTTISLAS
ncbi:organic hydroperoxide resistance protein [Oecophyllibacter saccharovorans]|uniref:organic hydroperoxide resistance protein n=1 Tax=Oecophyllibacter saccharovorans TaxID=2558360 RepID=UPI001166AE8D|nr:organic hydroperoxide resistance protein [Oecophyllibacter saccharovorans]TPW33775.1 organic hydroperoxide resistance protein [Oecophyllibacter saccharovorans]